MEGSSQQDTNVVQLDLARLERLIQLRLAESQDLGIEPALTVKVLDANNRGPSIPDDPAYYDLVVDRIVETLDHYLDDVASGAELSATALNGEIEAAFSDEGASIRAADRFVARLRCMACGIVTADDSTVCDTFLRQRAEGEVITVGSPFVFEHAEVARDYYARTRRPRAGEPVHVVEGWECPHCEAVNWAEVVIRDSLVQSIWSVALSRQTIDRAHYVTSECVELAARMTGRPTWSLWGDDVFEILFDELEAH